MHATLQLGDVELTGVTSSPRLRQPQGFFVTLTIEGALRAKEIFTALAEKGEIRRAFQRLLVARLRRVDGSVWGAMGDQ